MKTSRRGRLNDLKALLIWFHAECTGDGALRDEVSHVHHRVDIELGELDRKGKIATEAAVATCAPIVTSVTTVIEANRVRPTAYACEGHWKGVVKRFDNTIFATCPHKHRAHESARQCAFTAWKRWRRSSRKGNPDLSGFEGWT